MLHQKNRGCQNQLPGAFWMGRASIISILPGTTGHEEDAGMGQGAGASTACAPCPAPREAPLPAGLGLERGR